MNKKYIYIALAAVLVIVIALLFTNSNKDQNNITEENTPNSATPSNDSTNSVSVKPKPQNNVVLPKFITTSSLEGSVYRLKSYNGVAVPQDSKYSLSFEKETLSAKFCNNMSGFFILDGGKITASNLASTKMFCTSPEGVMEMETKFGSIVNLGANIYQNGNDIVISSKDAAFIFTGFGN